MKATLCTAIAIGALSLAASSAAQASFISGANLIANGNAEAGPSNASGGPVASIPSWTAGAGAMTVVPYGASGGFPTATDPGPSNRGSNFFAGGDGVAFSSITQTVSVADGAAAIDTGATGFTLSAYLGGYEAQNDYASLLVTFETAAGAALGTSTLTGPNATQRGGQTGLLSESLTGIVPIGTRMLVFELDATRTEGSYDDGYADNLSFVANAPTSAVPEPAGLAVIAVGTLALGALRRRRPASASR